MTYVKRAMLSAGMAFLVLCCYTLAFKFSSRTTADMVFAVVVASALVSAFSGLVAAVFVRNKLVVMVALSQICAIFLAAVVSRA